MRKDTPFAGNAVDRLKQTGKRSYWEIYKLFLKHNPLPAAPKSMLFVCKGNICRSPFAEAMARRRMIGETAIDCRSAGLEVQEPLSSPREAVVAAERFGVDLSRHRSRRIDERLVAGADMVLAMEARQVRLLRKAFPQYRAKTYLLPLFEGSPQGSSDAYHLLNIRDPYGRSKEDFIECFERIAACLYGIFSGIQDGGSRSSFGGITRR